jgi:nucleotide-binding universal stress UspA family protein
MTKDVENHHGPFRLLVAVNYTDEGRHAFEDAARISQRIPGCILQVVHVAAPLEDPPGLTGQTTALRAYVEEMCMARGGLAGVTLAVDVRRGDPVRELSAIAGEIGADLIVLGSDRGHRASWNTAPTMERLGDAMSCPIVVTVREESRRSTVDATADATRAGRTGAS